MRILELDLFRIIAAYFILLFHYAFRGWAADGFSPIRYEVLGEIFRYGYCGLYAFFMLSGYLIVSSIKKRDFTQFWLSRIVRLLPIYWICLIFIFAVCNFLGGSFFYIEIKRLLVSFTLLNPYLGIRYVDGAHWFLVYLFRFYIFCSIYILLREKINFKFWLIIGLIIHFCATFVHIPGLKFLFDRYFFIFFLSGMIFGQLQERADYLTYFLALIAFFACCHSAVTYGDGQAIHYKVNFSPYVLSGVVIFLFSFFIFTITGVIQHFYSSQMLASFSLLTYPLYLIHHNVGFILINYLNGYFNKYVILLITILVITFLAWLIQFVIYPLIERIMRKFRSAWGQ